MFKIKLKIYVYEHYITSKNKCNPAKTHDCIDIYTIFGIKVIFVRSS